MVKLDKIYTKGGDSGLTSLGDGKIIFVKPGDSDDILPELSARLESSSSHKGVSNVVIDLHNQEGWGRQPLAAGTKEGSMLEISASKALKSSLSAVFLELMCQPSAYIDQKISMMLLPIHFQNHLFYSQFWILK